MACVPWLCLGGRPTGSDGKDPQGSVSLLWLMPEGPPAGDQFSRGCLSLNLQWPSVAPIRTQTRQPALRLRLPSPHRRPLHPPGSEAASLRWWALGSPFHGGWPSMVLPSCWVCDPSEVQAQGHVPRPHLRSCPVSLGFPLHCWPLGFTFL